MTSDDSIAETMGSGGSLPGSDLAFILTMLASIPSESAAAIIVSPIAESVAESVTIRTLSPDFARAQTRNRFTAPLKALVTMLTELVNRESGLM
jgi:hypothetical protein